MRFGLSYYAGCLLEVRMLNGSSNLPGMRRHDVHLRLAWNVEPLQSRNSGVVRLGGELLDGSKSRPIVAMASVRHAKAEE